MIVLFLYIDELATVDEENFKLAEAKMLNIIIQRISHYLMFKLSVLEEFESDENYYK